MTSDIYEPCSAYTDYAAAQTSTHDTYTESSPLV